MTTLYKALGALALAVGLYSLGYMSGKGDKEVVVQEHVVTREGATQIVYRDRIITVTREVKPDGTVTETTTTKESNKTVDKKKKTEDTNTVTETRPTLSRYRLGLDAVGSWDAPSDRLTYDVSAAARLGDLPLWLRTSVNPGLHQVNLGVEYEF